MEYVWITKYALTRGIIRCAKSQVRVNDGYLYYIEPGMRLPTQVVKTDWCTSQQEAEKRVKELVAKKRAQLEKQLKGIDALQKKALTIVPTICG